MAVPYVYDYFLWSAQHYRIFTQLYAKIWYLPRNTIPINKHEKKNPFICTANQILLTTNRSNSVGGQVQIHYNNIHIARSKQITMNMKRKNFVFCSAVFLQTFVFVTYTCHSYFFQLGSCFFVCLAFLLFLLQTSLSNTHHTRRLILE